MKYIGRNVSLITDNDLCISCGACTHSCPFSNIRMRLNDSRGKWEATISDLQNCVVCNGVKNCLSVCPSYAVDYMTLADSQESHLLGRIENVYNGYSKDQQRRFHASSGGFIRDVSKSLLEQKEIDGIISIVHKGGLEYFPEILTDISLMPNSIYHNINYENAMNLLKSLHGRYLLIGLPCQITSITLLSLKKHFEFLHQKIYAKIALICGYTFDRNNARAFAWYNNFNMAEITYREQGRYRKTRLSNQKASLLFEVRHPDTFGEKVNNMLFFDKFLTQPGCLYCVDHIGYCADLVVGDAWQSRYNQDNIGTNLIISRTQTGENILQKVKDFHFEPGYLQEIVEAQSPNYALGAIGEGMKKVKLQRHQYIPQQKRTEHPEEIVAYKLKIKDFIKLKIIKKLLKAKYFRIARYIYVILESKDLLRFFLKTIIKRGRVQ